MILHANVQKVITPGNIIYNLGLGNADKSDCSGTIEGIYVERGKPRIYYTQIMTVQRRYRIRVDVPFHQMKEWNILRTIRKLKSLRVRVQENEIKEFSKLLCMTSLLSLKGR